MIVNSCIASAKNIFTNPAVSPFKNVNWTGEMLSILEAKLLSNPQHTEAPRISINPIFPVNSLVRESRTPLINIPIFAIQVRFEKCSLKNKNANKAVKVVSKFNSSDVVPAEVTERPYNRRIGPSTPPNKIDPVK